MNSAARWLLALAMILWCAQAEARQGHNQLRLAVQQTDLCLANLAEMLCEPPTGDSTALLATLAFFVTAIDKALSSVLRSLGAR